MGMDNTGASGLPQRTGPEQGHGDTYEIWNKWPLQTHRSKQLLVLSSILCIYVYILTNSFFIPYSQCFIRGILVVVAFLFNF